MTSWMFTLDIPKPLPGLSANDRVHWGRKAKSTAQVRQLALMGALRAEIPHMNRCRVDVVWVVDTARRRDTDNVAPLLKAIYDGLGADRGDSARIVPDDAPEFMTKTGATIRLDRTVPPHFEVTVTRLEGIPHEQPREEVEGAGREGP